MAGEIVVTPVPELSAAETAIASVLMVKAELVAVNALEIVVLAAFKVTGPVMV